MGGEGRREGGMGRLGTCTFTVGENMLLQTFTNNTHTQRVGQRSSDTVDHRSTLHSTASESNYIAT